MTEYANSLWERARAALETAEHLLSFDADAAASRAYYAAFFAVSALFALEGATFTKHTAVRAAVHRDLVKSGRWPRERGEDYSVLMSTREIGDYGGTRRTTEGEAAEAIAAARRIVDAVSAEHPKLDKRA